jgi:hemerythrin-like domain-containing protein
VSVRRRPFPELPEGASLKRAPPLVPLSQDHHHALVQSLRLRDAAAGTPSVAPAVARAFREHWRSAMLGHFADEEVVLFPRADALDPESVARLRAEHAELASLVERLQRALELGADARQLMNEIGWLVHDHVRFEERVLFEAVQSRLGPEELTEIGSGLVAHRAARGLAPGCPSPPG